MLSQLKLRFAILFASIFETKTPLEINQMRTSLSTFAFEKARKDLLEIERKSKQQAYELEVYASTLDEEVQRLREAQDYSRSMADEVYTYGDSVARKADRIGEILA